MKQLNDVGSVLHNASCPFSHVVGIVAEGREAVPFRRRRSCQLP
jgi:hypothetical protein